MTKITNRKVDKSFEIYLALYQAISGTDEADDLFPSTASRSRTASTTSGTSIARSCSSSARSSSRRR